MSNSGKIWDTKEVYTLQRGNQWITGNGSKALIGGGYTPSSTNKIETFNITVTGNATDFGDLTTATAALDGVSNTIRGVTGGGETPSKTNTMNKITIASTGNATDYGDLIFSVGKPSGASNGHGGLVGG